MRRLILLLIGTVSLTASLLAQPRQLYLVTGTPSLEYPARLYRIGANYKLDLVRELVPFPKGVFAVLDGPRFITVLSPLAKPTAITVVDKANPLQPRSWGFDGGNGVDERLTRLLTPAQQVFQALPFFPPLVKYRPKLNLKKIAVSSPALQLEDCSADEYRYVFTDGVTGGPVNPGYIFGAIRESGLFMYIGAEEVRIDNRPSEIPLSAREFIAAIATPEFFVLQSVDWSAKRRESKTVDYYVHDRRRDSWTTVSVPGNSPTERIFGPWLVTSEMYLLPGQGGDTGQMSFRPAQDSNPGHQEERNSRTALLPNVRDAFQYSIGAQRYITGRLTLTNLRDGRHLTLNTGMEDSEVLDVDGDSVLYRINDSIYRAALSGDKLGTTVLLVHDDDVPEVHWVFKAP